MAHHKLNSETEMRIREDRKPMNPWVKWGSISGCLASFAIVISVLPTIGDYASHVRKVWNAPVIVEEVQSNQAAQTIQLGTIQQDLRDIHQDVRDIKVFLYSNGKRSTLAIVKTNSIYE